jgi:hypothetical protein
VNVEGAINGLYPTPRRRALLALIDRRDGKVRHLRHEQVVRDGNTNTTVTDVVRQMLFVDWLKVVPIEERNSHEREAGATYYALTEFGRAAIERGKR